MNDVAKPAAPAGEQPSSLRMMVTMGSIGLLAGLLIVSTYQATLPVIKENKARFLEQAIFEVVPGTTQKIPFDLVDGSLQAATQEETAAQRYYACYDSGGALVGVALEAAGQGFQDIVRILYGYSPQDNCVVGMKVLDSRETPGLGDKIDTDPKFKSNFDCLAVSFEPEATTIAHPIELVKPGEKTDEWQIEAITGATISSRAVAQILRESTTQSVPAIKGSITELEEGAR